MSSLGCYRWSVALPALVGALLVPACQVLAERPAAIFSCKEHLGRDWPRMLVTYAKRFPTGRVRVDDVHLRDEEGNEVPVQFSRVELHDDGSVASAHISLMAEVPAGGSYRFELMPGTAASDWSARPKARSTGSTLTLENELVAIRLPKAGTVEYAEPLRFGADHQQMLRHFGRQEAAGIAPGPIQGLRILGNRWIGGSYFHCAEPEDAPRVLGYTCEVIEQGPLLVEARIRYTLEGDRYYQLTARVIAGDPAVRIDEQYDMRHLGQTRDRHGYLPSDPSMIVSLSSGRQRGGFKPDHAFWGRYAYGSGMQPQNTAIEKRLGELGFDFSSKSFGSHKIDHGETPTPLFAISAWNPYGNFAAHVGLVDSRTIGEKDNTPFVALVPMHAGTWRADGPYGYNTLFAHEHDVAIRWPLSALLHPNRVYHTGEHDPELPYTFGRRQWALVGGPLQTVNQIEEFRNYEGYINLDDYKDWTLRWPERPQTTYPRMFFDKGDVARWKKSLDRHPVGELLREFLYFNDDEEARTQMFQRMCSGRSQWTAPLGQTLAGLEHWFPLWRQSHMTANWSPLVDELLSSDELTRQQREQLRGYVAAVCHMVSEPDFNPRGSMAHLGTVNMSIIRFLPLAQAAVLIPDHPRADEWLDMCEQFVRFKLAGNTAPGGGWSELLTYYDASAPNLIHCAHLLQRTGRTSEADVALAGQLACFPLSYLPPPDPRFGVSAVPCWGHEATKNFGQWLPGAALLKSSDTPAAKALLWGWDRSGRIAGYHDTTLNRHCAAHADLLRDIPKEFTPERLVSTWTPGIGAVLRAHAGEPQATYLAYRQGYMLSHTDDNQGDFVLYAKGAPLVGMSLFGYPLHQHDPYVELHQNFGWYSHPRYGSRDNTTSMRDGSSESGNVGAWNPSSEVHAHAFGPSVDYLRGHSDNEGRRWTRQIMLLKGQSAAGPNYCVFRDSTDPLDGDPATLVPWYWNLRTLGGKDQLRTSKTGLDYTSQFGPKLHVRLVHPPSVASQTRDASRTNRAYAHVDQWREDGKPVMPDDRSLRTETSETLSVTSFGPIEPGNDLLAVLYPHDKSQSPPKCEPIAPGVARVTTTEGTDWVFLDRNARRFANDEVTFRGTAGAVRVRGGEVHLVLAEGPGEVGYQGTVLRSNGPATRVIPTGQLKRPRTIDVPMPESDITFALDPKLGAITHLLPEVAYQERQDGFAFSFDSTDRLCFFHEGVVFVGRRGGVVVDRAEQTLRVVMIDGERVGCAPLLAWAGRGPYELTFHADRIVGRSAGGGRFVNVTQPVGIDGRAGVIIDGVAYTPGTAEGVSIAGLTCDNVDGVPDGLGRTLVIPLMPGIQQFEVRNIEQPPVFREPRQWTVP